MRRSFIICILILLFSIGFSTNAKAESTSTIKTDIKIDGDFSDWNGKPEISDLKHDIKNPKSDIVDMKYIADNDDLYLYVERLSGSKSEPWHFSVIIPNAPTGQNKLIDLFNKGKQTFVPVFDITTTFDKGLNLVNVSYNGQSVDTTLSCSSNGKEIEFKIPLSMVGLSGINQEVQFVIQSDNGDGNIADWSPNEYPITITTGPTGWIVTSVLFFIGVSCLAFMVCKKQDIDLFNSLFLKVSAFLKANRDF